MNNAKMMVAGRGDAPGNAQRTVIVAGRRGVQEFAAAINATSFQFYPKFSSQ
jgi:hypothetical protein